METEGGEKMTALIDALSGILSKTQDIGVRLKADMETMSLVGQGDTVQERLAWLEREHGETGLVAGYEAAVRMSKMNPRKAAGDILFERNTGLHALVYDITHNWD